MFSAALLVLRHFEERRDWQPSSRATTDEPRAHRAHLPSCPSVARFQPGAGPEETPDPRQDLDSCELTFSPVCSLVAPSGGDETNVSLNSARSPGGRRVS